MRTDPREVDRPPSSRLGRMRSISRRVWGALGPGVITGAADDDPSGIATYSVAGAAFGYAPLWTALFSFPLMSAVQLMCARLGMVTGLGLAAVIRRRYSRFILWCACLLLIVANVINIGADLGGIRRRLESAMLQRRRRRWPYAPFAASEISLRLKCQTLSAVYGFAARKPASRPLSRV